MPSPQGHAEDGGIKEQPPELDNRHSSTTIAGVTATEKEEAHECRHGEEGRGQGKHGRTGVAAAGDMPPRCRVLGRGEEAGSEGEREKRRVRRRYGRERNGGGGDGDNAASGGAVEGAGEQNAGGVCEDDETGGGDEVEGREPEEKG